MRWLLLAFFTTAAALAGAQNVALPEGDGKAIVSRGLYLMPWTGSDNRQKVHPGGWVATLSTV